MRLINVMAYYFEKFPEDLKETFNELISCQARGIEVDWDGWFKLLLKRGIECS